MNPKKLLVIGELNIDVILNGINGFPVIGEEILADSLTIAMGSSSAIFASNIASIGINTSFCGMVGKDSFGKFILGELKKKQVNPTYIIESPEYKTGVTIVLNYSHDRANVTYCGAMDAFNKKNIPFEKISQFNHLHLSSYFLQKGLQADIPELFKIAKKKGLSTSLDLQWDPNNQWQFPYEACLPFVDIFLPNESELLLLAGENRIEEALEKIGKYAHKIIVKRGIEGALYYEKGKVISSKAFLHNHFIDAIGAGDSFNAGFISSYLEGLRTEECLRFGNLAGAINTTSAGGVSAFGNFKSFSQKAKELFNIEL